MKKRLYSLAKFLIGWPLSIIALFFIGKLIQPQLGTISSQIHAINPLLVFYGLSSFILFYFVRVYVWNRLLRAYKYTIPFKETSYMWAISEVKRYIPGNVWAFFGRTMLFQAKGVKKKDIGVCLLLEAELLVLGSILVSFLSLPFLIQAFALPSLAGKLFFIAMTIIIGVYMYNRPIFLRFPLGIRQMLSFLFPHFAPRETILLIFLSTLSFFFFGLGYYLTIASYTALDPQMVWSLTGFFALAFVGGYLSILTPAGFGVREGIIIAGLMKLPGITTAIAAFASLFSRVVLIIAEVFFIALVVIWHKSLSLKLYYTEIWIAKHKQATILLALILLYCLYFVPITFLRYDNFNTGKFDLGNMSQTVWNTTQGRIFTFTNPDGTEILSRLAFHADFILVLFAPFYALWQTPKVLLLLQTVILALGAIFVYLIGRDVLKNRNLGLVFSFIYLLNPALQRTNLYDFHAVTLATTFFLGTYYFYQKKNYLYFGLFALLAALCKEQLWVIVALFGIFVAVFQRKWLYGSIMTIASFGMFYFLVWQAIPSAIGGDHFALSFFAELGNSPTEVVSTVIFSPWKLWEMIAEPSKIDYLKQIFSPLGYLPLLGPLWLLFAIPDLLINLLSSNDNFHQIYYQYTATITPFLFIAAIHGTRFLQQLLKRLGHATLITAGISIYLIGMTLNAAYLYGPLPGAKGANIAMLEELVGDRAFIDSYLESIPAEYKVAASNSVGSHLTHREHLYVLPNGVDQADMVVFLLVEKYTRERELKLIQELKQDKRFILVVDRDPFIVFKRSSSRP